MRILFRLFLVLLDLLLLPLRLVRRALAAPRGAYLRVDVDGWVAEIARPRAFWDRSPRRLSLHALREVLALAGADARVRGVVVVLERFSGGMATATSLREALGALRAAGKELVVYLPSGGGTRELFVASAADRLVLGPATSVSALGFAVEAPYVKGALDRAGVEAEVFARGRYKTAGERLVAARMSDAEREQLSGVLDTAWEALIDALASGRRVERAVAEGWVNEGPWPAAEAVARGLADAVLDEDELARALAPALPDGAPMIDAARYGARRRLRFRPLVRPRYLAVIEVHGPIASARPLAWSSMAVDRAVCGAMKRALDDPRARGVMVHIDSRGGSALASERMLRQLTRLAAKKPVVACMGDAAASGGYLVAMGAGVIVAQPTTLTGSIGVIAARFVVGPLLDQLGVTTEVVKRGARADLTSPARHLDEGERAAMERELDAVYGSFVDAVARGRGITPEAVLPLAGGRVWSGRDARAHGLVDALGGFDVALAELRRRVGPGAERLEPQVIPGGRGGSPLAALPRLMGGVAASGALAELLALALATSGATGWLYCPTREMSD
ncbi:MAG: signal peptide peptidase SppA [Sorangiineae bacterium]|nr:signal peptide peptidase SppA [Sorangiineae bacterium]